MSNISQIQIAPHEDGTLDTLHGFGLVTGPTAGVARVAGRGLVTVDPTESGSGVAHLYTPAFVLSDVGIYGSGPRSGRAPQTFDAIGPESAEDEQGLDAGVRAGLRWTGADSDDS